MIELVTTDGLFALDGGEWAVTNNVWLVGNDAEVAVIDAAHDHEAIATAVSGRRVRQIILTHGHNDHINAAAALQDIVDAPIYLHPDDTMLWRDLYADRHVDGDLADNDRFDVGGLELVALHTPGHSPGCCCLHVTGAGPDGADVLFSGDTLFCGGPGATGRSYSNFDTIIASIRSRLLNLPAHTIVHTGHGDSTTIGAEAPHLQEWIEGGG